MRAAGHHGGAHARRRCRHSGVLYRDGGWHQACRRQGRARDSRPQIYSRGGAPRRRRAGRGLGSGPLGQSHLQVVGAQFQPGDGDGGATDHRAEPAHRRARRARSGKDRDAGNFRRPRAARALWRTDGDVRRVKEEAMNVKTAVKPMTRLEMAKRLADEVPEGWYVNLGIGAPLQVADYVPEEREVVFQSENGILGMGPAPEPDKINRWLINAGKQYITLRTGGSYMHHADSFALIRGGHLDLCVL